MSNSLDNCYDVLCYKESNEYARYAKHPYNLFGGSTSNDCGDSNECYIDSEYPESSCWKDFSLKMLTSGELRMSETTQSALFPILWVGPAGCGKLTAARKALGCPVSCIPKLQTLLIGDYSARFWELPTHIEVDIMDLSMMDKQILPEIINQLLSTRDVTCGKKKVMIIRHVHGLSPTASIRLRACLEELVWSAGAPAMIWCTARTVTSSVAAIMDGFVYKRCTGERLERSALIAKFGVPAGVQIPTNETYISEMVRQMVLALDEGPPSLAAVIWIRTRIYELLGRMITGADLVAGLTWAIVRMAAAGTLSSKRAKAALDILARSRWVPSYRTPLMLEMIVASLYDAIATATTYPLIRPTDPVSI